MKADRPNAWYIPPLRFSLRQFAIAGYSGLEDLEKKTH
jgi:hypothetical protein